ncbi:MAG: fibrillarin-like rRNA/tRNA 2'-O-methyltransferase [Conexivisphaerales archaeon]
MQEITEDDEVKGLYWVTINGRRFLATKNLAPGISVYGERTLKRGSEEYRIWDPYRSKLAAAIFKGLSFMPIGQGSRVLYLGASTGTTVSHVSDIVGSSGVVFAVEVSHRVARELVEHVAKHRRNVIPIVEDARNYSKYGVVYGKIDVVYSDIAQPDQTEIALGNCRRYLSPRGYLMLVVKSRSIDVVKEPEVVIRAEQERIKEAGLDIVQSLLSLEPYDRDHGFILSRMQTTKDSSS